MVAVPAREAESLARAGFAKYPLILFFGPDEGLVSERAEAVAKATTGGDAGNIVRMEGDDVATDPGRLLDEANAISMFGGARAIRIRAGSKSFADALKAVMAAPPVDARIIVEAGDLKGDAPLRKLIEKAPNAAAAACYAEDARDLGRLIDEALQAAGLKIAPDARGLLIENLGQDRRRSRMEIDKLALYCMGRERIETADVEAIVTDAAAISADLLIDAVFGGKLDAVETEARRLFEDGMEPGVLLGFALRHVFMLQQGQRERASGLSMEDTVRKLTRNFRRHRALAEQLPRWPDVRLQRAVQIIGDAALAVRRNAALAEATAIRAFWSLALSVGRG